MSEDIVVLEHITKRFPRIVANDDVSISIRKGEIYALLGENGAGKSTLMSILFGLYEPDEGRIIIRGEEVEIHSPREASALSIGMVHQHFKLVQDQSVTENIILGIEPKRKAFGFLPCIDIKSARERILKLSEAYGLEVDPDALIEDLSVAARQRVEILKMLYRDAEILIFDEPTALLTPQEINSLLKVIKALRDGGKTIILITHKLDEIKKVASRCAILCRGKLVGVYDVEAISTDEMASLMVGYEYHEEENDRSFTSGETILEVKDLTLYDQDGVKVVEGVSFSVHSGEIVALAGVAGNGQVEIADMISGMLESSSGAIIYKGNDITDESIRGRTEMKISYIPEDRQEVGLLLDYDLSVNLALRSYYRAPYCKKGLLQSDAFKKNGEELIKEFDIRASSGCSTQVRSMSGGNQQKAIIAREISQDADLYIFVQPTRGLDVGAIRNIHKEILGLRDRGKAILLVSLELEEIMSLSDTIIVMYNGKIQAVKRRKDVTADEIGSYMMGARNEK